MEKMQELKTLVPVSFRRFWKHSWIYFALAFVAYFSAVWVSNMDRQTTEFTMFTIFGVPIWVGAPSIVIMLLAFGFVLNGFKIIDYKR